MKKVLPLTIWYLVFILLMSAGLFSQNTLSITEVDGIVTTNYPIQLGRPFVKGEIPDFPQVLVNGTPVSTQADVKQRYSDGSVKHAILSFYIPTLNANTTVGISFQNQSTGNNTGFLNASQMLNASFDFNAQMSLTNGTTLAADARTMLQNNDLSYWLQGGVATSILLSDDSLNRQYDMGFDSYRSFHPIFQATFYPLINKIKVRFIGEVANTEALEDVNYDLNLAVGNQIPQSVYSKPGVTHYAGSRWTKEYWIGGAPSRIAINHNLGYLKETMFFPNFDIAKSIPGSIITNDYTNWNSSARDIFDAGFWTKAMGAPGARPEIGPIPGWDVQWLFTGDQRSQEIAEVQSQLAASWPVHFREGNPNKLYLRNNNTVYALGKAMSITNRQSICIACGLNYNYTLPQDAIVPVGTMSSGGWNPEDAHQPDAFSAHYILTGDHFYLEEMYFWASWSAAYLNGAATMYDWGRGPTGAEGGLTGQIRAQAWIFRNRCMTAFCAPDNTVEKTYYETLVHDAIEIWEGAHNITGTPNFGSANWNWGKQYRYNALGNPTLNQWERGNSAFAQSSYGIDPAVTAEGISNFEQDYLMYSLGRSKELGYASDSVVAYLAKNFIGQAMGPGYNKYLLCNGRIPTVDMGGNYFTSWSQLKTGYDASWQNKTSFDTLYPYDYTYLALTAMSYAYCEPGGVPAWHAIADEVLNTQVLHADPKFAIVYRDCQGMTAVSTKNDELKFDLFPNPTSDKLYLHMEQQEQNAEVVIYDLVGKEVLRTKTESSITELNLNGLNNGFYVVGVQLKEKMQKRKVAVVR